MSPPFLVCCVWKRRCPCCPMRRLRTEADSRARRSRRAAIISPHPPRYTRHLPHVGGRQGHAGRWHLHCRGRDPHPSGLLHLGAQPKWDPRGWSPPWSLGKGFQRKTYQKGFPLANLCLLSFRKESRCAPHRRNIIAVSITHRGRGCPHAPSSLLNRCRQPRLPACSF